jgi:hypothetical protein
MGLLSILKGDNPGKTYNFIIKVGFVQMVCSFKTGPLAGA